MKKTFKTNVQWLCHHSIGGILITDGMEISKIVKNLAQEKGVALNKVYTFVNGFLNDW